MAYQKHKLENFINRTYGKLTVIGEIKEKVDNKTARKFICECSCGNTVNVSIYSIVNKDSTSCGCFRKQKLKELRTTHNKAGNREYNCWHNMKRRIYEKDNPKYKIYGGRGIKLCDKWHTFEGFWEDMQEGYEEHLTLDRIDVNGDYCKENCRWATLKTQAHNIRKRKNCTSVYTGSSRLAYNGLFISKIVDPNGERLVLGNFSNELEAGRAYDNAYEKYYGSRPNKTERID